MKNWKLVAGIAAFGLLTSACATPTVVESQQANDANLNCEQLLAGIEEASGFEQDARDERGVTTTNAAAVLFFPLALAATYFNTADAIEAAEERREHLLDLYEARGCQ